MEDSPSGYETGYKGEGRPNLTDLDEFATEWTFV